MSQMLPTAPHAVFDTLRYFQRLKDAGVPDAQAQAQVDVLREIVEDGLATKRDLAEMEHRIKADIIKWVAGMLVAQAIAVAALVKLL